jgi:hypothetical protein
MNGKEREEYPVQNVRCIRCPDCGEEIMMVPVLSQMIEAIENHISSHKPHGDAPRSELPLLHPKAPEIRENLTEQVLQRAAEISDALNRNQTWINK